MIRFVDLDYGILARVHALPLVFNFLRLKRSREYEKTRDERCLANSSLC